MGTRLKQDASHQNDLMGYDMRCSVLKSSRLDDDAEMKHCCNVLSAKACVLTNGGAAGSAVLYEVSGHVLE